jgi:hypothetical protein
MGSPIGLAASALWESGRADNIRAAAIRVSGVVLCAGLAAMLVLAAFGCAAAALWILALPSLGAVGAPLIFAATLFAVVLILMTIVWFTMPLGWRRRRATMAPQVLLSEATRLFNEHKGSVLLAAVFTDMAAANGRRHP